MKKILIVDDDVRGVTSNLAKALKEEGFDVSVLNDAERVIELLKLEKFDGIILDIMMPVPESWSSDLKREPRVDARRRPRSRPRAGCRAAPAT